MLSAFLEDLARQPFADGAADCVLSVADWIVMRGHPDPAEPYRGRYRTALGRQRTLHVGVHKVSGWPVRRLKLAFFWGHPASRKSGRGICGTAGL